VSMLGIPILVVAGLTPRRTSRVLITVAILMLVAVIAWSFVPMDEVDPAGLAVLIASFVVVAVGIRAWGTRSVWPWFVAALSYEGFGGLRNALYGPEWQARVAGGLTVLAAAALIALIMHRSVQPRAP
jgi:hypothetical protein